MVQKDIGEISNRRLSLSNKVGEETHREVCCQAGSEINLERLIGSS